MTGKHTEDKIKNKAILRCNEKGVLEGRIEQVCLYILFYYYSNEKKIAILIFMSVLLCLLFCQAFNQRAFILAENRRKTVKLLF